MKAGVRERKCTILKFAMASEKTFYLETFGCQMNAHDSEKVIGTLVHEGYSQVESEEEAGLILYNTCSIRDKAEQKVFNRLNDYKKLHKAGKRLAFSDVWLSRKARRFLSVRRTSRLSQVLPPIESFPKCSAVLRLATIASRASMTVRRRRPSRRNSHRGKIHIADTSPSLRAATSSAPTAWFLTLAEKSEAEGHPRCFQRHDASSTRATLRFNYSGRTLTAIEIRKGS